MKKGCQCVDCEHRDYCNKRNKGGVVQCINYNKGKAMTEQEWLQTCTTEQLADVFFEYRYTYATPRQKLWMSASEECIKKDIVEWLKQPHTIKE